MRCVDFCARREISVCIRIDANDLVTCPDGLGHAIEYSDPVNLAHRFDLRVKSDHDPSVAHIDPLVNRSLVVGSKILDPMVRPAYAVTMHAKVKTKKDTPGARERILASARKLIAQHGFEATSTKEIAAHAGVPSGLVFYYFKTKDELLEAIFESNPPLQILAAMREAAAKPTGDRVENALRSALNEAMTKHRYETYILMAEIASSRPIAKRLRQIRKDALANIADFFSSLLSGDKPVVDPEILAQVVTSAIIIAVTLDQPKDVDAYVRGLALLVRAGLAKQQANG
jgi:AcrR family transcriptional regulator